MYKTFLDFDKFGFIQTYKISDKKQVNSNHAIFRYFDTANGTTGILVDGYPKYKIHYAYPDAKVHVEAVLANKDIDNKILDVRWRRWRAAKLIQRAWRRCISNPQYAMCHKRLISEFKAFAGRA